MENKAKLYKRIEGVTLSPFQAEFLLDSFFLLIVGKPGSGKSALARELLTSKKYYKGKFDYTIIISPSAAKLGIPTHKDYINTVYDL